MLKVWGGSTGGALTLTGELLDIGQALGANGITLTLKNATSIVANRAVGSEWMPYFVFETTAGVIDATFPLPYAVITAQVAAADAENASIDIWPMFDTNEALAASVATHMRVA